jgi:hypothetical protein
VQQQLEKIDMLDFADLVALNKFDKRGALDAIRVKNNTSATIIYGMRRLMKCLFLVPLPHSSMIRDEYALQSDYG